MSQSASNTGAYTTPVVVRARALADAGWSVQAIRGMLQREFGRRPAEQTVRGWLSEDYAAKRRKLVRSARRRARGLPAPLRISDDLKAERMAALLERGIPPKGIGQVSAVFWGEELTGGQVKERLRLNTGRRAA